MKYAYVYGFDERDKSFYPIMQTIYRTLKKQFPELPLFTTSKMYADLARDPQRTDCFASDWYCPLTSVFKPDLTRRLQQRGHQVWWYVCCGPEFPFANFASLEYPAIEARILAWQSFQYHVDGLLYWNVNSWSNAEKLDESKAFHANFALNQIHRTIGDGQLIYPGKNGLLPSIRLANIRDGSEDYDYLTILGKEAYPLCDQLSHRLTDFTRDPLKLRQTRRTAARLIRAKRNP